MDYTEDICKRCGECCKTKAGIPCEHLRILGSGTTRCDIYGHHLGWHQTIDGKAIRCVTIETELQGGGRPNGCAYVALLNEV